MCVSDTGDAGGVWRLVSMLETLVAFGVWCLRLAFGVDAGDAGGVWCLVLTLEVLVAFGVWCLVLTLETLVALTLEMLETLETLVAFGVDAGDTGGVWCLVLTLETLEMLVAFSVWCRCWWC